MITAIVEGDQGLILLLTSSVPNGEFVLLSVDLNGFGQESSTKGRLHLWVEFIVDKAIDNAGFSDGRLPEKNNFNLLSHNNAQKMK